MRLRIDGILAVSRRFSGGKQWIKFANARNRGRVSLSLKTSGQFNSHAKCTVQVSTSLRHYYLLWGHLMVATASRKVTMIIFTRGGGGGRGGWFSPIGCHYRLQGKKVLHVLLFRINKLDRDFLHWQILSLVCPLRNHVIPLLSHQSLSACKDGGYREVGLLRWRPDLCPGHIGGGRSQSFRCSVLALPLRCNELAHNKESSPPLPPQSETPL